MYRSLVWVTLAAVGVVVVCKEINDIILLVSNAPHNVLSLDLLTNTLHLTHPKGYATVRWGLTLPEGVEGTQCGEGDLCMDFGVAKVVVTTEDHCQRVSWTSHGGSEGGSGLSELKDCVVLDGHWYGGGQQVEQPWPLEKHPRRETPFVTADMLSHRSLWYGGVSEAYWVSSLGVAVRVDERTPLFLSVPDSDGDSTADELCLSARHEEPFVAAPGSPLTLTYTLCSGDDVRKVHEATFPKFFSLPEGIPDSRMIQDPIWSTWAEYHKNVNETKVMDLARSATKYGFNNSQVEIDDDWETCYGEAVFNLDRFPDPRGMVDQLHEEGFRVTLWIHPFINSDCPSFVHADDMGYFVKDSLGATQLTHWWDGNKAGIIDFTNTEAVEWWTQRLHNIKEQTGMDSFKFDAGEASWLPENYTLQTDERFWPNMYTLKYVEAMSQFGGMVETRVGRGSQRHPIFVRMLDKDSTWIYNNGLKTLVPSLLHFGLLGYPFVLPDMIGGNGYIIKPSRELFVRWAQANALMPSLQFSIMPWKFDEEVVELCREVTRLHTQYTPLLLSLAEEATVSVSPMMRPTWWLCPTLEECLTADQQFLVGDDLLVAPVVTRGATSLSVVVPPGQWYHAESDSTTVGPTTVTFNNITLDTLIILTRV